MDNYQSNRRSYFNKYNLNKKKLAVEENNQTNNYIYETDNNKNYITKGHSVKNNQHKTLLRSLSTLINGTKNEYSIPSKLFNSKFWKNTKNNKPLKALKFNYIKYIKHKNDNKENKINCYKNKKKYYINPIDLNNNEEFSLSYKRTKNNNKHLNNINNININNNYFNSPIKAYQCITFDKFHEYKNYFNNRKNKHLKISQTQKIIFTPNNSKNNRNNYNNNTNTNINLDNFIKNNNYFIITKEINLMLSNNKDVKKKIHII